MSEKTLKTYCSKVFVTAQQAIDYALPLRLKYVYQEPKMDRRGRQRYHFYARFHQLPKQLQNKTCSKDPSMIVVRLPPEPTEESAILPTRQPPAKVAKLADYQAMYAAKMPAFPARLPPIDETPVEEAESTEQEPVEPPIPDHYRQDYLAQIAPNLPAWMSAATGQQSAAAASTSGATQPPVHTPADDALANLLDKNDAMKQFRSLAGHAPTDQAPLMISLRDATSRLSRSELDAIEFVETLPLDQALGFSIHCIRMSQQDGLGASLEYLLEHTDDGRKSASDSRSTRRKAAPKVDSAKTPPPIEQPVTDDADPADAPIVIEPPPVVKQRSLHAPLDLAETVTLDLFQQLRLHALATSTNPDYRTPTCDLGNVRVLLNQYTFYLLQTHALGRTQPRFARTGVSALFAADQQNAFKHLGKCVAPLAESMFCAVEEACALSLEWLAINADTFGVQTGLPPTTKKAHATRMQIFVNEGLNVYNRGILRYIDLREASLRVPSKAALLLWQNVKLARAVPTLEDESNESINERREKHLDWLMAKYASLCRQRAFLIEQRRMNETTDPFHYPTSAAFKTHRAFLEMVFADGGLERMHYCGLIARRVPGIYGITFDGNTDLRTERIHPGTMRNIPGRADLTAVDVLLAIAQYDSDHATSLGVDLLDLDAPLPSQAERHAEAEVTLANEIQTNPPLQLHMERHHQLERENSTEKPRRTLRTQKQLQKLGSSPR